MYLATRCRVEPSMQDPSTARESPTLATSNHSPERQASSKHAPVFCVEIHCEQAVKLKTGNEPNKHDMSCRWRDRLGRAPYRQADSRP